MTRVYRCCLHRYRDSFVLQSLIPHGALSSQAGRARRRSAHSAARRCGSRAAGTLAARQSASSTRGIDVHCIHCCMWWDSNSHPLKALPGLIDVPIGLCVSSGPLKCRFHTTRLSNYQCFLVPSSLLVASHTPLQGRNCTSGAAENEVHITPCT